MKSGEEPSHGIPQVCCSACRPRPLQDNLLSQHAAGAGSPVGPLQLGERGGLAEAEELEAFLERLHPKGGAVR